MSQELDSLVAWMARAYGIPPSVTREMKVSDIVYCLEMWSTPAPRKPFPWQPVLLTLTVLINSITLVILGLVMAHA